MSLIPEWGRSPGERNGTPLQYSYLGNPIDRGAWWAAVQDVTKDRTWLCTNAHIHNQWYYIHSPPHATFTPTYLQNFPPFPTETLYSLNNSSSISPPAPPVVKCRFSHGRLCVTLWTVAHQASLSMGFSRQFSSGLPFPPPGDLPNPGIKPESLMSLALAGRFFTTSATWEAPCNQHLAGKSCLWERVLCRKTICFVTLSKLYCN